MERDWRDFKALYGGEEGARTKFEVACETLLREMYPNENVQIVRANPGDEGIDVLVGEIGIEPIKVFQCKFFLEQIGNSQKNQIRESFKKAIESEDYEMKEWTLCLPKALDIGENKWWARWKDRTKKKYDRVEIQFKNGNELIYLMKKHGVYDEFFEPDKELKEQTTSIKKDTDEIKKTQNDMLKNMTDRRESVSNIEGALSEIKASAEAIQYQLEALTTERHAELDHARDLLDAYKPTEALEFLEKLKNRIWHQATDIIKFRLLTNIAVANFKLGEKENSAKLMLEALTYNSDDNKAVNNAALAYLILDQPTKAQEMAFKILDENPGYTSAYSTIIQTSAIDEKFESIIEKIPSAFRKDTEVAYALGNIAYNRNNYGEAKKWLEIALENDNNDNPEIKALLGGVLIEILFQDQSVVIGHQINEEQRNQLNKAIELLTSAWDKIEDVRIKKAKADWILGRGIAKNLVGDVEGAIKDVEKTLELDKTNHRFLKNLATLYYRNKNYEKAIEIFRELFSITKLNEAALVFAFAYSKLNKYQDAIYIINEFLSTDPPKSIQMDAKRTLVDLYLDADELEKAKDIFESLLKDNPTDILNLVYASRFSELSSDNEKALSFLYEAKRYLTENSPFKDRLALAEQFYNLEQFADAADIYEKIVDKTLNTNLTHKLINSYYWSGQADKALETCELLRTKYGSIEYLAHIESVICEEIGDLVKAKEICQNYLKLYPYDFEMKLRLAIVNLRANNIKELDEFLSLDVDIEKLTLKQGIALANLYSIRNADKKTLEIMYELRRKYYENPESHLKYVGLFLMREKQGEYLDAHTVSVDTAVHVEDESGNRKWYIIENRKEADVQRKELDINSILAKKLLGSSIGDQIILKEDDISKKTLKIIEIQSKYVYVFQQTGLFFEEMFPSTPGLWMFNIGKVDKKESFQPIFDQVTRQHEHILELEQLYKEGKVTIGLFAKLCGKNILDAWMHLQNKPDLGIKCCSGTKMEKDSAIGILSVKPKLIADIISIMTFHSLNAGDIIINTFDRLGVAQSTLDFFRERIKELSLDSEGCMTMFKEGDQFFRHEVSAEQIETGIEYLENIIKWIEDNCDIMPCNKALDIGFNKKHRFDGMIGRSSNDTILIASESGNLLYSDDERLRAFAKGEFDIYGVWTQAVLLKCLNRKTISKEHYNQMIVKLASFNYHYTSIDTDILIEAARQSNWLPSFPFKQLVRILKNSNFDSVLRITVGFLKEATLLSIPDIKLEALTMELLDQLTVNKNKKSLVIDYLISGLNGAFMLIPYHQEKIISIINNYRQIHFI